MSRWKAAFIHLLISALTVGSIAAYIIYLWYPPALMHMAKADRLLMLIGGVDLVVGPLLTLIIYKTGKRHLKLDLAVIGLIQCVFLAYGLFTIFASRPVFLVAVPDRFELVFANEIPVERLSKAKNNAFKTLGVTRPRLVGAKMPTDAKEKEALLYSAIAGGGDIQTMPQYYVEYSDVVTGLLKHGKKLRPHEGLNASQAQIMRNAAKSYGRDPNKLLYLTLASSREYAVMLVDANSGEVVGPVNVDP